MSKILSDIRSIFYYFRFWVLGPATALIGYEIHRSIFWALMDMVFIPLAWVKWFVFHEVTITIIKSAFSFFTK